MTPAHGHSVTSVDPIIGHHLPGPMLAPQKYTKQGRQLRVKKRRRQGVATTVKMIHNINMETLDTNNENTKENINEVVAKSRYREVFAAKYQPRDMIHSTFHPRPGLVDRYVVSFTL